MIEPTVYTLMSLREGPFNEIVAGTKKYEFRTRYLRVPTIAFIYVSGTVRSVKAVIEFDRPIIGSCKEIAAISEECKPGTYDSIMSYLRGKTGYAIPVKRVMPIKPVSLASLRTVFPGFVVPQSYYILNKKPALLQYLIERQLS